MARMASPLHSYEFPRPAVTVDTVVFTIQGDALQVLLIKRGLEPFAGQWALPGGFVQMDEGLDDAARRELAEETNVRDVWLEQLYTFGAPARDPRGRTITVAYFALIAADARDLAAATDSAEVAWFPIGKLPKLAFDHEAIVLYALQRLRWKLDYTSVGFQLLPKKFTLTALQRMYEVILGKELDKRNFRKKVLAMNIVEALDEKHADGPHRPAQLYRFSEDDFVVWRDRGLLFPFGGPS